MICAWGGYKGIDIVKYLMSILVVLRHAIQNFYVGSSYLYLIVTNGLSTAAVPFFFISTGFLFFDNKEQSKRNIQKQIGRLIKLYITWSVAYCPLAILEMIKDKKLTLMGFTGMIQKFVFSGIYYHLWYIPAAAVALFVVWTLKKKIKDRNILILFTILFVIGLLDDSYACIISVKIFEHYNKVFLTTRNGVFFGGLLVEIGSVIAEYKEKTRNIRKLPLFCMAGVGGCLLIVESMWNYSILGEHINNLMLMAIPTSITIFLIALKIEGIGTDTKKLRNMSTLIYVIHPLMIVLVWHTVKVNMAFINVISATIMTMCVSFVIEKMAHKYAILREIM